MNAKQPHRKIGFVLDDTLDSSDGVQTYVKTMARELMRRGHQVRFLVGETSAKNEFGGHVYSLAKNLRVGANQNRMGTPLPTRAIDIDRVLKKENFDVLFVQMIYSPFMAGRVISRASDKSAVVGMFHVVIDTRLGKIGTKLLSFFQQHTLARFDAVLATSSASRAFAQRYFGIEDVVESANAVLVRDFAKARPRAEFDDDVFTIVFLGRLVERKGCQHLIEAIGELKKLRDIKGVLRVVICGDGPLRSELENRVHKLDLDDIVQFVGFIAEAYKPAYLASADIAVFPSTGGESFGIVLIEAMATGRSVVLGGDNPGYKTVLGDRPELLIDPTCYECFAKRILWLMDDADARRNAIKWQQECVKKYDVDRVADQVLAVFEDAILARSESEEQLK